MDDNLVGRGPYGFCTGKYAGKVHPKIFSHESTHTYKKNVWSLRDLRRRNLSTLNNMSNKSTVKI